jgi:hypothetical protein
MVRRQPPIVAIVASPVALSDCARPALPSVGAPTPALLGMDGCAELDVAARLRGGGRSGDLGTPPPPLRPPSRPRTLPGPPDVPASRQSSKPEALPPLVGPLSAGVRRRRALRISVGLDGWVGTSSLFGGASAAITAGRPHRIFAATPPAAPPSPAACTQARVAISAHAPELGPQDRPLLHQPRERHHRPRSPPPTGGASVRRPLPSENGAQAASAYRAGRGFQRELERS